MANVQINKQSFNHWLISLKKESGWRQYTVALPFFSAVHLLLVCKNISNQQVINFIKSHRWDLINRRRAQIKTAIFTRDFALLRQIAEEKRKYPRRGYSKHKNRNVELAAN